MSPARWRACLLSRLLPRLFPSAVLSALLTVALAGCMPQEGSLAAAPTAELASTPRESSLELGRRMLAAGEPALALKAFNVSLGTEGVSAEAFAGAGIAAQRQGLLNLARRHLQQAVRLDPGSASTHNNLGVVLHQLNEYHAARSAFRVALDLTGGGGEDGARARQNLARVEADIARLEGGEAVPIETHRLVRLGSDQFRLEPAPEPAPEPAGTAAGEAGAQDTGAETSGTDDAGTQKAGTEAAGAWAPAEAEAE